MEWSNNNNNNNGTTSSSVFVVWMMEQIATSSSAIVCCCCTLILLFVSSVYSSTLLFPTRKYSSSSLQSASAAAASSCWRRKLWKTPHKFFDELLDKSLHEAAQLLQHDVLLLLDENSSMEQEETVAEQDFHRSTAVVTHFCFLVHGHRGFSRDLGYVQCQMRQAVAKQRKERWNNHQAQQQQAQQQDPSTPPTSLDVIVHSVSCNEGKTADGLINGGERLVEEIVQVVTQEMQSRNHDNISISFLGNSLGGLYARYAVALLARQRQEEQGGYCLDGKYNLVFNTYCTTATPHLGIAGHTFVPIPRTAEIGVALTMGQSGRDLFRLNDLLRRMACDSEFIAPLASFRQRIAYANAYGTDFPVPMQTAAFLSESSTYPHHWDAEENDDVNDDDAASDESSHREGGGGGGGRDPKLVIAKLRTSALDHDDNDSSHHAADDSNNHTVNDTNEERRTKDELAEMSRSLDALGWKKVFLDVRKEIPRIPLPTVLRNNMNNNNSNNNNSTHSSNNSVNSDGEHSESEGVHLLRERGVAGSRDVAAALSAPLFDANFHWPVGHNMIVAFSRSRLSSYMNKAGRPVVDAVAHDLVQSIVATPTEAAS